MWLRMTQLTIKWEPSAKQKQAFDYLLDDNTTELFYGGGAGGGKSYLGCVWIVYCCLRYPGIRVLMGRAVLKSLKQSTLLTLFQILKEWGLVKGKDYKYNTIESVVSFYNGSDIYLKDLMLYPSDPEFDSLGSTEYTQAFIDEGSQVTEKAKNIVMSRLRYKLEEYDLIPKLLIASNPSKNFLYYEYYKPHRDGKLPHYKKFIKALVQDNPYISKHYIENLKKLDKVTKERLLYGNFEYDDDPAKLFDYDAILDIFTNFPEESEKYYLTVDVARFGEDKTVIMVWKGLFIEKIYHYAVSSTDFTEREIEKIRSIYNISRRRVAIDEDGVGGGVVDHLPGVRGFVNNSRAIIEKKNDETHNFSNLKSQCYFRLADYVNKGMIGCYKDIEPEVREMLIEDLEQIKIKDMDKDMKLRIVSKDKIKENIGRSTDFGDAMMMRMLFVINEKELFWAFGE